MHPIERLRYVARARGVDAESLVVETAGALRALGLDPSELVVSCRRIVERHPTCGPLWWLCARVLTAAEPATSLRESVEQIGDDRTARRLAALLPDDGTVVVAGYPEVATEALCRRGDVRVLVVDTDFAGSAMARRLERADVDHDLVPAQAAAAAVASADLVLVEALALDDATAITPIGSGVATAAGAFRGVPVDVVAGRGRRLPGGLMGAVLERTVALVEPIDAEVEAIPMGAVGRVHGPDGSTAPADIVAECEFAPELVRASPM
ncbi:MAG: hypothetical protein ACK5OX_04445 [Desertimonas sp.]